MYIAQVIYLGRVYLQYFRQVYAFAANKCLLSNEHLVLKGFCAATLREHIISYLNTWRTWNNFLLSYFWTHKWMETVCLRSCLSKLVLQYNYFNVSVFNKTLSHIFRFYSKEVAFLLWRYKRQFLKVKI